jgi:hypothetical protein
MWQKAYTSQNNQFSFVESPLYYNQKLSSVLGSDDKPTSPEAKRKIFDASLNRLIVYKDKKTGVTGQYIVNYIPDLSYLEKHKYDISHNQINKLDKDFTGYIKYMTWDGEPKLIFRLEKGKVISKANYKKEIISAKNGQKDRKLSGNSIAARSVCYPETEEVIVQFCWVEDPENNIEICVEMLTYRQIQVCFDVFDLCSDPAVAEYFIECYNGPNPPSGPGPLPPGPTDPGYYDPFYPQQIAFISGPVIDLYHLFNCFGNVPDNAAIYTLRLCVDIPSTSMWPMLTNPANKQPGHTFLTIIKTNGNNSVAQSFGFYPIDGVYSITDQTTSKMVNDGGHEYDAYIEKTMYAPDFEELVTLTRSIPPGYPYTINGINSTSHALYLFNSVVRPWSSNYPPVVVPNSITQPPSGGQDNYGQTANGLYNVLYNMASTNNRVYIGTSNAPTGSGLCP